MAYKGHKTGWSAEGVLRSVGPGNPNPQDAVHLQVDFGEKRSEYYTVQFGVVPPPGYQGEDSVNTRGKAEIIWSVEGNFVRRMLSVWNGASISGLGQGVSIKITDDSYNPLDNSVKEYRVSTQVTRGTRPAMGGNMPPIFQPPIAGRINGSPTVPVNEISWLVPPAGELLLPIPQDCGINSVHIAVKSNSNTVPIEPQNILFEQFTTGLEAWYGSLLNCNRFEPLVPGATDIRLSNFNAESLRFSVLWGIEG